LHNNGAGGQQLRASCSVLVAQARHLVQHEQLEDLASEEQHLHTGTGKEERIADLG
jgi:hypothetical protein